jgi:hypothetical protein
VPQLAEDRAALRVHGVCDLLPARDVRVGPDAGGVGPLCTLLADERRFRQDQACLALRALGVVHLSRYQHDCR